MLSQADAEAHKQGEGYDPNLVKKVKRLVTKVKSQKPDEAGDKTLEKSEDIEKFLINDSLSIFLGHETGLNDLEYMLELVEING